MSSSTSSSSDNQASRKRGREESDDEGAVDARAAVDTAKLPHHDTADDSAAPSAATSVTDQIVVDESNSSVVAPPKFSYIGGSELCFTGSTFSNTGLEQLRSHAQSQQQLVSDMCEWCEQNQGRLAAAKNGEAAALGDPFGADVIIEVGAQYTDREQHHGYLIAHKFMLVTQSEYFRNMFSGQWAESLRSSASAPFLVTKPNATPYAMRTALNFIYSGSVGKVVSDHLKECFLLALEMLLDKLVQDLAVHVFFGDKDPTMLDDDSKRIMFHDFFRHELNHEFYADLCLESMQGSAEYIMLDLAPWSPTDYARYLSTNLGGRLKDENGVCISAIAWACTKRGHTIELDEYDQIIFPKALQVVSGLPADERAEIRKLLVEPFRQIRWGCMKKDWIYENIEQNGLEDQLLLIYRFFAIGRLHESVPANFDVERSNLCFFFKHKINDKQTCTWSVLFGLVWIVTALPVQGKNECHYTVQADKSKMIFNVLDPKEYMCYMDATKYKKGEEVTYVEKNFTLDMQALNYVQKIAFTEADEECTVVFGLTFTLKHYRDYWYSV